MISPFCRSGTDDTRVACRRPSCPISVKLYSVNAVSPSLAMHPHLVKVTSDELLSALTEREAFKRYAEPWEVANVMVFLASDYASYMTGEVVSVSAQHP